MVRVSCVEREHKMCVCVKGRRTGFVYGGRETEVCGGMGGGVGCVCVCVCVCGGGDGAEEPERARTAEIRKTKSLTAGEA